MLYVVFLLLLMPLFYEFLTAIISGSRFGYALFMDERITFEPVRKALRGDWLDKVAFFFDGHDNRYGRLLWNVDFVMSSIPHAIWGEQGQIIATRLTQTLILMAGYLLILWTFIKATWVRMLCFICLLLLPETFYYVMMPKPEPLMVLLIGVLLYQLLNQKTKYFFLCTGVLAGLKISAIPVCMVFVVAYFIYYPQKLLFRSFISDFKKIFTIKILAVFCLLVILMTCLVNQYIKTVYADELYAVLAPKKIAGISMYLCFVVFNGILSACFILLTGLYLSPAFNRLAFITTAVVQLLAGLSICSPYLYFTPFNFALYLTTPISHGADNTSVNVFSWLQHMYQADLYGQPVLLTGFVFCTIAMLIYLWVNQRQIFNRRSGILFLLILFLLNLFPIIFLTKRIWGFYLLLPMVFLLAAYGSAMDQVKSWALKIAAALVLLLYPIWAFPRLHHEVELKRMAGNQAVFKNKQKEYLEVCRLLGQKAASLNPPKRQAYWDPNLFFPDKISFEDVKVFWGPFNGWKDGRTFIVLSDYPDRLYRADPSNKNYGRINESISQFRNFTDSLTGTYREYKKDTFRYHRIFIKR
ncbi:MAG: hypothetical protein JWM28_3880 [Chitinophagaceae bacterium]|nr:hypothetical protein [Chitinophagaceae bacterium]